MQQDADKEATMIIKTFVIGMVIIGITFILAELHRYQVYKGEIEQEERNGRFM